MKTYTRDNIQEFNDAIESIKQIIVELPNDRLKENYSFERLQVDEWVAVSLGETGFSSIAWRPLWNNNCRVLNRFYKKPTHRFINKQFKLTEDTETMIRQQVQAAMVMDFDCAFVSRETKRSGAFHYLNQMNTEWIDEPTKCLMWHTGYQWITWTALKDNVKAIDLRRE